MGPGNRAGLTTTSGSASSGCAVLPVSTYVVLQLMVQYKMPLLSYKIQPTAGLPSTIHDAMKKLSVLPHLN
jgi:hypothetical protein